MPEPETRLQRVEWTVLRRLDGIMQGDYRTLFHGAGVELSQLREYQPGDDVRSIDWNVTARMDNPYVRQFLEDREVTVWFLLDVSPSVDFGAAGRTKRDLLSDFVAIMARLLTRHGNRVGAVLFSGTATRVVPAAGGRGHVVRLLREVAAAPRLARAPRTDLGSLIAAALPSLTRRSLVFLVSDFLAADGWDRRLAHLVRRHETVAVHLGDPSELSMPDVGPLVLADAETGEQIFVDTHDRRFRARFAEAAARQRAGTSALLRRAGVDEMTLSTDSDLAREIVRIAAERARRRGAATYRAARGEKV
jgi:uncharacterized protein (DUF58 family)